MNAKVKIKVLRTADLVVGQWYIPEGGDITFEVGGHPWSSERRGYLERLCEEAGVSLDDVYWVERDE